MKVEITHPDKVLFPKSKITKADLAKYYSSVSSLMIPLIKDRPISMKRYPKEIKEGGFFQKHAPDSLPSFIKTAKVGREEKSGIQMILCNDRKTLLWLANQNCITPHIWLSRIDKPKTPDRMIFDLDPPKGKDFQSVCEGALILKEVLEKDFKLKTYVTTTGSKGLHVVVPIKRECGFDEVRGFAREIGHILTQEDPKRFTMEMHKSKRRGRIFIDTARNGYAQTVMAPYAVRPIEDAPIATPLSWDELKNKNLRSDSYTIGNIGKRLKSKANPWSGINRSTKSLKIAQKRL